MENPKNSIDFRKESLSIHQIAERLDEKWTRSGTRSGTRGGAINNFTSNILTPFDEEYQDILQNLIDQFPFKSVVANERLDANILIQSEALFVAVDAMNRLIGGETLDLLDGRKINSKNYPVGYLEDFRFTFLIVKPSKVGTFDYARINKY